MPVSWQQPTKSEEDTLIPRLCTPRALPPHPWPAEMLRPGTCRTTVPNSVRELQHVVTIIGKWLRQPLTFFLNLKPVEIFADRIISICCIECKTRS